MKKTTTAWLWALCSTAAFAQDALPQIRVTANHRYLETLPTGQAGTDGKPFFWLGDTAWELFHRLNREEAETYLETRRQQGFNVIQAVALAEFDGLRKPNAYGDLPLLGLNPATLALTDGSDPANPTQYDYWDHVDFVIKTAAAKGLYIGLLPTWGDKVAHLWGDGPIVFDEKNAMAYGQILGERYRNQTNIIWILGGDRPAKYKGREDGKEYDDRPIWRAMAAGIVEGIGHDAFITYHPWGGENSTTQYIHDEPWLDMNSFQSGHGSRESPAWDWVERDWRMSPPKPTLDMEPCYEDHPVNPWDGKWTRERGYFTAHDVRARIYRGVFAGGCGVTYGHHFIWQFADPDRNPLINNGDTVIHWRQAMVAEAAGQMKHLKNLMLSRPYATRVADQSLILSENPTDWKTQITALRDEAGSYAMFYLPENQSVVVDFDKVSGKKKRCWWYDPRTGQAMEAKGEKANFWRGCLMAPPSQEYRKSRGKKNRFTPPTNGEDWVLVVEGAAKTVRD